jgi:hypothetical protein
LGSNKRATDAITALTNNFGGYKWDSMATGLMTDDTSVNAAKLLAGDGGQAVREALGLSDTKLTDLATALETGDASTKEKARE